MLCSFIRAPWNNCTGKQKCKSHIYLFQKSINKAIMFWSCRQNRESTAVCEELCVKKYSCSAIEYSDGDCTLWKYVVFNEKVNPLTNPYLKDTTNTFDVGSCLSETAIEAAGNFKMFMIFWKKKKNFFSLKKTFEFLAPQNPVLIVQNGKEEAAENVIEITDILFIFFFCKVISAWCLVYMFSVDYQPNDERFSEK